MNKTKAASQVSPAIHQLKPDQNPKAQTCQNCSREEALYLVRIGQAIGDPETQRRDIAASVFLLVPEIAHDIGASPEEILKILVIAIIVTATIHYSDFDIDVAQEKTLELLINERKAQQSGNGASRLIESALAPI